ncbi:MAG TPA: hypothetical protein VM912_21515 [Terriglobales bacterium]|nr:hypothetical protein [Terriglobales bacterium]
MAKDKNPAAQALGRLGGQQRAKNQGWKKISKAKRREMARKAAEARWAKWRKEQGQS